MLYSMRIARIVFLLLLFSCRKETVNEEPALPRLYKITEGDKTIFTFDYDEKGRLVSEIQYFQCETEFSKTTYHYSEGKLVSRSSKKKKLQPDSIYTYPDIPTLTEPCGDDAIYQTLTDIPEYDQSGRVIKITNEASVTEYAYDPDGTVKVTQTSKPGMWVSHSSYDAAGNLIEENRELGGGNIMIGRPLAYYYSDLQPAANLITYEYDTGRNPLYTAAIWPFHLPNNPVKMYRKSTFTWGWSYTYDIHGFPLERKESNGLTWVYHYR